MRVRSMLGKEAEEREGGSVGHVRKQRDDFCQGGQFQSEDHD